MDARKNHTWLHLLVIFLILAAAIAVALALRQSLSQKDKNVPSGTAHTSTKPTAKPKACAIFTLAEAKQVLGDSAKGGDNQTDNSSEDIDSSICNYSQDLTSSNAPVSGSKSASLTVRDPKTADGIKSNQKQFGLGKPDDALEVGGYGDAAYWDPDNGQLNILKNNIWYSLRLGAADPQSHSLDETRQLADTLINKM